MTIETWWYKTELPRITKVQVTQNNRKRIKSSKNSKRYHGKKKHGALNTTIKSENEEFSHGSTKFNNDKFKLELVDLDGRKQVLNIIDKDTYNFPIIADNKLPLSIKPESTVLLPNPMWLDTSSKNLYPKRSGETSYALDSPVKKPKYFSKNKL